MDIIEKHVLLEFNKLEAENSSVLTWVYENKANLRCCVCGGAIKNVSLQRLLRPYHWDSRECFKFKPRRIIALEREYGMDIVDILKETTARYGKIKAQCQALGISAPYFYDIMKRYCGDVVNFMVKHATGKRKTEYIEKSKNR